MQLKKEGKGFPRDRDRLEKCYVTKVSVKEKGSFRKTNVY